MLIFCLNAYAFVLDNKLPDKNMERRATDLFKVIKCPFCSGEVLSESPAYDMREAIRKKISDGYTDQDIITELKALYGDSIIMIPSLKDSTYILWCLPFIVLFIGSYFIYSVIHREIN
ncbi:cytochrome c-type biogenesis protein [Wolbachia pipientis]|nr:cytochrome c-type biogenesis protein [Wolbachia pipientis]